MLILPLSLLVGRSQIWLILCVRSLLITWIGLWFGFLDVLTLLPIRWLNGLLSFQLQGLLIFLVFLEVLSAVKIHPCNLVSSFYLLSFSEKKKKEWEKKLSCLLLTKRILCSTALVPFKVLLVVCSFLLSVIALLA